MADETNGAPKDAADSRTLSRSSLYAPLTAYASGSFKLPKNVGKSHADSSFVDWLQQLSADYHQSCGPGDPRNTGNQFLTKSDVADRVMHRTLNMFGKEYGAKLGHKPTSAKPKKRKKHKQRPKSSKNAIPITEPSQVKASNEFLGNLNHLWTDYMKKLLRERGCECVEEKLDTNKVRTAIHIIEQCAATIEWVGAHVTIESCAAFCNWQGRQGVLVSMTKHCWVIFESKKDCERVTQLTVPKSGSTISVHLNLADETIQLSDQNEDTTTIRIHLNGDSKII